MKIEDVKLGMLVDCKGDEDIGRPALAKVPVTYVDYETQNITVFGRQMHAPWWVPIGDVSFVDESPKEVPPKDTMSDERQLAMSKIAAAITRVQVRVAGMVAENQHRMNRGETIAYPYAAFEALISEEGLLRDEVTKELEQTK